MTLKEVLNGKKGDLDFWLEYHTEAEVKTAILNLIANSRPNLMPTILWLENGCNPMDAAKELRLLQERSGLNQ